MTARCISYVVTGPIAALATVVLTPCWLARLFGARAVSVDLCRHATGWRTVATDRELGFIGHGADIRDALDFREVGEPARWVLTSGSEAIAP